MNLASAYKTLALEKLQLRSMNSCHDNDHSELGLLKPVSVSKYRPARSLMLHMTDGLKQCDSGFN